MSPRKITKIGPVFAKAKRVIENIAAIEKEITYISSGENSSDSSKPLKNNLASSPVPFDLTTGIKSNSPEVLLFSNFTPVYDERGKLNSIGDLMQAKQDAILVSSMQAMQSIFQSGEPYQQLSKTAKDNKKELIKFCEEFGVDINDLLSNISDLRGRLDIRSYKPSDDVYKKYQANTGGKLEISANDWRPHWSATKTWLQLVKGLKETVKQGVYSEFTSEGSSPINYGNIQNGNNPYKITPTKTEHIKRFNFRTDQPVFADLASAYKTMASGNIEQIIKYKNEFKLLFTRDMFTRRISSDRDNIANAVAKLSYALCREYRYSTKMTPSILSEFGYVRSVAQKNMIDVWDYLIGEFTEDITVIPTTPRGNGKSLSSLAQHRIGQNEILLFEDRYIDDSEIGTNREGAVITPGSQYYIESSLNSGNTGFDTSRLNQLVDQRLKPLLNMFDLLVNIGNPLTTSPYVKIQDKTIPRNSYLNRAINPTSNAPNQNTEKLLDDPIKLIRIIEEKIIAPSGLLDRKSLNSSPKKIIADRSILYISAAVDDPELKTLLFMHQFSNILTTEEINSSFDSSQDNVSNPASTLSDSTIKNTIKDEFTKRLNKFLSTKNSAGLYTNVIGSDIEEINYLDVTPDFTESNPTSMKTLQRIGAFIKEFTKTMGIWFNTKNVNAVNGSLNANNTSVPTTVSLELTPYAGIQKTIIYAMLFDLCLRMVYAANPYRIYKVIDSPPSSGNSPPNKYTDEREEKGQKPDKSSSNNTNQTFGTIYYYVKKLYEPIIPYTDTNIADRVDTSSLVYDQIEVSAEQMLYSNAKNYRDSVNLFRFYTSDLLTAFTNFSINLNSGRYVSFLSGLRGLLQNNQQVNSAMNQEQLLLTKSKLKQVSERCKDDYITPISNVIPYFTSLSSNPNFNNFIPIEDTHMVSWNAFLKSFLNEKRFRGQKGFNSKIMSIGLPLGLYRRLQTSSQDISGNITRSGIIKLKIFRVDTLRPDLVHAPLSFLFDMRKFPVRNLKDYVVSKIKPLIPVDTSEEATYIASQNNQTTENPQYTTAAASDFISGKDTINKKLIPMYEVNGYNNVIKKISNFNEAFRDDSFQISTTLTTQEKFEVYNNHVESFLLEEYIRFVADIPADENRYFNYNMLRPKQVNTIGTVVQNSISQLNGLTNTQATTLASNPNTSIQRFFANETLFGDLREIKRVLASPKKFDRVFHIVFDPDDFIVQVGPEFTSEAALKAHEDVLDMTTSTIRRKNTRPEEITFDKYYVTVETWAESGTST